MSFEITKVHVWAGEIEDRPGALAEKLQAILDTGATLDFIISRPNPGKPGTSIMYLAPLFWAEEIRAAEQFGLRRSSIPVLRIEGPDRPGLAAGIAQALARAGLNIHGLSAAGAGDRALFYVRFENDQDVVRAAQLLTPKLT
jgi:hypothetical protein